MNECVVIKQGDTVDIQFDPKRLIVLGDSVLSWHGEVCPKPDGVKFDTVRVYQFGNCIQAFNKPESK